MSSVSVLLAAYNGEKYLAQQLDSIISQTYKDFQIIIRDDGSTDDTVKIILDYQACYPEIVKFVSDGVKSGSPTGNFFKLLKYADSDYIMFSDQDDVWFPDKIKKTLYEMQNLESQFGKDIPILVFASSQATDENLNPLNNSGVKKIPDKLLKLNRLLVENCGAGGCVIMSNKSLYKNIGDYSDKIMIYDWWFALYASACGIIRYLPEKLMFYRQHGKNTLGSVNLRGLRYRLKRFNDRENIKTTIQGYAQQAELFRDRYSEKMSKSSMKILNDFISLNHEKHKLIRIIKLLKGNFLKNDWVRAIAQIIYV